MFDSQTRELLSQPLIVRVTTIRPDGYPHTVPVWFKLEGEQLLLFTGANAQKAVNARLNPKGAIAFGGDPVGTPAFLIEGDFSVEPDADHHITARITHHYEPPDKANAWLESWEGSDHVILRLTPRRIIKLV